VLDQIDEDVLEARLARVEILERDPHVRKFPQQRGNAGALGLRVEHVAQPVPLVLER
jgi:hypothetical protein